MLSTCSFHGNSMNNLLSYCWLIDAKIRASDKDLPVPLISKKLSLIAVMNFAIFQLVIPVYFSQNQNEIHVLNIILGRYKNV